jgi:hypothetical protein
MKQEFDCPNDTVMFRCSNCGNEVNAQVSAKVSSDGIESERRRKLRYEKQAKVLVFMIPFLIGVCLLFNRFLVVSLFRGCCRVATRRNQAPKTVSASKNSNTNTITVPTPASSGYPHRTPQTTDQLKSGGVHPASPKLYAGNVVRRPSSTGPPTVKW